MLRSITVAATAALLTAISAPAAAQERDCFHTSSVTGWSVIDDDTIRVNVGPNREYALRTFSDADQLRWDMRIALESPTSWICTGDGATGVELRSLDPTLRRSWAVTEVTRLPAQSAQSPGAQMAQTPQMQHMPQAPAQTADVPDWPQQSQAAAELQAALGLTPTVPLPMEVLRVVQRGNYTSHDLQQAQLAAIRSEMNLASR